MNEGGDEETLVLYTAVSFILAGPLLGNIYVTAVTVARGGLSCGSHALYVLQGCQAA